MDRFRENRKDKDAYQRMKENYDSMEKTRREKISEIDAYLHEKREKRDDQMEAIREKFLQKKKGNASPKNPVNKKGKPRR